MIPREVGVHLRMTIENRTWEVLPLLLSEISTIDISGKLLLELKRINNETEDTNVDLQELKKKVKLLVKENGGTIKFSKALCQELSKERNPYNPHYITSAIFIVKQGKKLALEEQKNLSCFLKGNMQLDSWLQTFYENFNDKYFAGDITACDYPYDITPCYVGFYFDEDTDHTYDDEELKTICRVLNEVVGRKMFDSYEGCGSEESVADRMN